MRDTRVKTSFGSSHPDTIFRRLASPAAPAYIRSSFVRTALLKRARRVANAARDRASTIRMTDRTHRDSIEALTGNRCSSLTFESKGGAEVCTSRSRDREAAPRRAATRPEGL